MPQGLDKKCFRVFCYLEMFGFQFVKKSLLFQIPIPPRIGPKPILFRWNKEVFIEKKITIDMRIPKALSGCSLYLTQLI
ncbi:MAG: hypothetical protein DA405_10155 [Bacteroidetes bacterium]|nr:MAG: hypothetical protein DA405_10155 [Bacteroidota bacterium]